MQFVRKSLIVLGLAATLPTLTVSSHAANSQGTPDEAHALVKKAIAYFQENGQEKTMAALNDNNGEFVDRDLYVFVHDDQGVYYAIAPKPAFIGKNLSSVRDANGKFIVKEQIEKLKTADNMWQEYHWENPVTKKIALKKTYCEKLDTLQFCAGAYAN